MEQNDTKTNLVTQGKIYYTELPNLVYESMLTSDLSAIEREIIILVNRFSTGFDIPSAYLRTQLIKSVIPIQHNKIKQVITNLIIKKVLIGKPIMQRKNGAVMVYELRINRDLKSWNVKQDLHKKVVMNESSHFAIRMKKNPREAEYLLGITKPEPFQTRILTEPDEELVPF
jgi:hypothetical protein